MKRFTLALTISMIYLVIGNIIGIAGMSNPSNEFLNSSLIEVLFFPYVFVGGMSAFAGWDWFSLVLEVVIFVITIPIFYSVLMTINSFRHKLKK